MIPFSAPVDEILFSIQHIAKADRLHDWDGASAARRFSSPAIRTCRNVSRIWSLPEPA